MIQTENTYTDLQVKLDKIKRQKALLNYSNGMTLLQGIIIEQTSFENCILLSLKLEQYFQRWKDVRTTEPMLEKHSVHELLEKTAKRIVYLNLIEEEREIATVLNAIKDMHVKEKIRMSMKKDIIKDKMKIVDLLSKM